MLSGPSEGADGTKTVADDNTDGPASTSPFKKNGSDDADGTDDVLDNPCWRAPYARCGLLPNSIQIAGKSWGRIRRRSDAGG